MFDVHYFDRNHHHHHIIIIIIIIIINIIWLIEVGVTNKDRLKETEIEKGRKYELLANELEMTYHAKVFQIPVVITWDGLVTHHHRKHLQKIGVDKRLQAYLQYITIKRVLIDARAERPCHDKDLNELFDVAEQQDENLIHI